jgi:hypothetical protein
VWHGWKEPPAANPFSFSTFHFVVNLTESRESASCRMYPKQQTSLWLLITAVMGHQELPFAWQKVGRKISVLGGLTP